MSQLISSADYRLTASETISLQGYEAAIAFLSAFHSQRQRHQEL